MQTMTENEQQEVNHTGELRLLHPQTRQVYVAVKEEWYSRVKEAMEFRATYPAVIRALDLESDPGRGAYNDLRRP